MTTKKGNIETDEKFLRSVALPTATDTYTVIGHGTIIDKVRKELNDNGFIIVEEKYTSTHSGEIALAKVYVKSDKDEDMGMLFTWWNSYNKRVKFGCAVGSFIYDNRASLIGSEGMSWIRKHTGTADQEATSIMEQLIAAADNYFDKIIAEKNKMKAMPLSVEDYGCVMGALYFEHELITPNQASAVVKERKKPTHNYSDQGTLWELYKILMFGIEGMDITKWVKSQQKLHHMIMTEYAIKVETPIGTTVIGIPQEASLQTPVDDSPQIDGIPNGDTMSDTDDEGVDVEKYIEENEPDVPLATTPIEDVPAVSISPEQVEVITETQDNKFNTEVETEEVVTATDDELDLLFSVDDSTADVLENINTPVEIIEPTELADGLDIPQEVKEEAVKAEAKMKELYGGIRPYSIEEVGTHTMVIIDETLESFCI